MIQQAISPELLERIVTRLLDIKHGMPGCTPQHECSLGEYKVYKELFSAFEDIDLLAQVRATQALRGVKV